MVYVKGLKTRTAKLLNKTGKGTTSEVNDVLRTGKASNKPIVNDMANQLKSFFDAAMHGTGIPTDPDVTAIHYTPVPHEDFDEPYAVQDSTPLRGGLEPARETQPPDTVTKFPEESNDLNFEPAKKPSDFPYNPGNTIGWGK